MIETICVGIGLGIWTLIVSIEFIFEVINTRFRKSVEIIQGEIVDFVEISNSRRTGKLKCPVIYFIYNGDEYMLEAQSNAIWFINKYKLNQKIEICYNPRLIEKMIIIKKGYKDIVTVLVMLILSLMLLGAGIGALLYKIIV